MLWPQEVTQRAGRIVALVVNAVRTVVPVMLAQRFRLKVDLGHKCGLRVNTVIPPLFGIASTHQGSDRKSARCCRATSSECDTIGCPVNAEAVELVSRNVQQLSDNQQRRKQMVEHINHRYAQRIEIVYILQIHPKTNVLCLLSYKRLGGQHR